MSKLNTEAQVIEGVKFFYAKLKTPSLKYQSTTDKEYAVTVQLDKATAKAWNKAFGKQKVKEWDYDDFVEKFGADNAIGEEEQFMLTIKKPANYRHKETGELTDIPEIYRPRAFIDSGDGELEDITYTHLIGNGSTGTVQYEVNENSFGTFAKLLAIKVDDLVVVEQGDTTSKFNALGKVKSLAESPKQAKPEAPVETQADQVHQADEDDEF